MKSYCANVIIEKQIELRFLCWRKIRIFNIIFPYRKKNKKKKQNKTKNNKNQDFRICIAQIFSTDIFILKAFAVNLLIAKTSSEVRSF